MRLHDRDDYWKIWGRFWDQAEDVRDPEACWLWIGQTDKRGYGVFALDGKKVSAHRVAFLLTHARGLAPLRRVRQTCAEKRCVNPAHLALADSPASRRRRYQW